MTAQAARTGSIEFTVIIPTRNRPRQLLETLRAISEADRDDVEIVVVADGRGQKLDRVIAAGPRRMRIRLIEQDHSGPGAARNVGAAYACGRYLAFTDDDCLPSPGWLGALKDRLDRSPGALVGGRTVNNLPQNVFSEASQLIQEIVYAHYNKRPECATFLASNNLALRAEDFAAIGGFDQTFRLASEDREFCDRWLWNRLPMIYEPAAVIGHAHELTGAGFCSQHFRYGRGAARYHITRARRGSGKFTEHLSFHRRSQNWLTPRLPGSITRQFMMRTLLFVWQGSNAAGFLWENLVQALGYEDQRKDLEGGPVAKARGSFTSNDL